MTLCLESLFHAGFHSKVLCITPYCILMNNSKNKSNNNNWHYSRKPLCCTALIFRNHERQFTSVTHTAHETSMYNHVEMMHYKYTCSVKAGGL